MSETPKSSAQKPADDNLPAAPERGPVSQWLQQQGFDHELLPADHLGVETIGVDPVFLPVIAAALKGNGFDYLQCQGGYDEGPGAHLVCFYHLVAMAEVTEGKTDAVREVRVKVFCPEMENLLSPVSTACCVVLIGKSGKRSTCLASASMDTPSQASAHA